MTARAQDEAAHRLKGSSQGIGAWAMARAAQLVENAAASERQASVEALAMAFADIEAAIHEYRAAG